DSHREKGRVLRPWLALAILLSLAACTEQFARNSKEIDERSKAPTSSSTGDLSGNWDALYERLNPSAGHGTEIIALSIVHTQADEGPGYILSVDSRGKVLQWSWPSGSPRLITETPS